MVLVNDPQWKGAHVRVDDTAITLWREGDAWVVTEGHYKAPFKALGVLHRGDSEVFAREVFRCVKWGR